MGSVQFTASFSPSKPHAVPWANAVDWLLQCNINLLEIELIIQLKHLNSFPYQRQSKTFDQDSGISDHFHDLPSVLCFLEKLFTFSDHIVSARPLYIFQHLKGDHLSLSDAGLRHSSPYVMNAETTLERASSACRVRTLQHSSNFRLDDSTYCIKG